MASQTTPREAAARKTLRAFGLHVEAVGWVHRGEADEFAAVVASSNPDFPQEYERALEVLTDPRCPLIVAGERHGRHDIRIYVAFPKAA